MKNNILCPCGSSFYAEYDDEIDLDKSPETLEKIMDGSFMNYDCPYCAKKHKPEFRIRVLWKSRDLKLEVIPELDRGEFYRNKKSASKYETVIGYPEMADRLAVINSSLEPVVIETLKSYLLAKAEENYPGKDINVWYHAKGPQCIEFHLDGIRTDEVAVMRIPQDLYDKTLEDYKKHPRKEIYTSLRTRTYLSVQNILCPEVLK